ncbi:MAG: right-handed parallel beta-helix repeat-containing protein [Candidatus Thorarchaeota archaeon]
MPTVFIQIDTQSAHSTNRMFSKAYIEHDIISVIGNEDFLNQSLFEGWPGSGSEESPIIISGYSFRASRNMLRIVDTTLYFEFRDNQVNGIDNVWCGLYVANASNGALLNNVIFNTAIGIHTLEVDNCTFSGNTIFNNRNQGIVLELTCIGNEICENEIYDNELEGIIVDFGSYENKVYSNHVYRNQDKGIEIYYDSFDNEVWDNVVENNSMSGVSVRGERNHIYNNTLRYNDWDGITMRGEENTVYNNTIYGNGRCGVKLYSYGKNCTVMYNQLMNNTETGVSLASTCKNNTVTRNELWFNGGQQQATDRGQNNTVVFNFYNEWITPDSNGDGIVDIPYLWDGDPLNEDPFPLVYLGNQIPEPLDTTTTSSVTITTITTSSVTITTTSSSSSSTTSTTIESTTEPSTTQPDNLYLPLIVATGAGVVFIGIGLVLMRRRSIQ